MGDWVVDGWRGNKAGRPGQQQSGQCGSKAVAVAVLQIDGSSSSSNGQTGGRTTQAAPPRLLLLLRLLPASQASVG